MRRWVLVAAFVAVVVVSCNDPGVAGDGDAMAGAGGTGDGGEGLRGPRDSSGAPHDGGSESTGPDSGGAGGGASGANPGGAGGHPIGSTAGGTAGEGGATDSGGAGRNAGGGAQAGPTCIERGAACDTLDDCLVGELCVEGACAGGKAIGDPCSGEEYCGRDVRCIDDLCTYRYSLDPLAQCGADPQFPEWWVELDPWLRCAQGTYCSNRTPFNAINPPYCQGLGKTGAWCGGTERCAPGYFCNVISSGDPEEYPDYRCAPRVAPGPDTCQLDAPEGCQAGYVCNWVIGPEELAAHDPGAPPPQMFGCQPPAQEGEYCNPLYPYIFNHYSWEFPSQCGPNLYCNDEASSDSGGLWDNHGRCLPLPEPTIQACDTDDDCTGGEVCKEFYLGFLTCSTMKQEGDACEPDVLYPCADGLQCVLPDDFASPSLGECRSVAEIGGACHDATLCSDDGACVGP